MNKTKKYRIQLRRICIKYHVTSMYIFGSRAHEILNHLEGTGKLSVLTNSDVDIGVKIERGVVLNVRQKALLGIELEDLFDVNQVDLIVISEADPYVAANIVRGERIYCDDEYTADEYDLYILRRAGDLAYLERERIALTLGEGDRA